MVTAKPDPDRRPFDHAGLISARSAARIRTPPACSSPVAVVYGYGWCCPRRLLFSPLPPTHHGHSQSPATQIDDARLTLRPAGLFCARALRLGSAHAADLIKRRVNFNLVFHGDVA